MDLAPTNSSAPLMGRPSKHDIPVAAAKDLWDRVVKKFEEEDPTAKQMKLEAWYEDLQKKTHCAPTPLSELKTMVKKQPEPPTIPMSENTIDRLCEYVDMDAQEFKKKWIKQENNPRIAGLFGNWYVYHTRNSIIRRGKIRILGEQQLHYEGTRHLFGQGTIHIFSTSTISVSLINDYKILHLLGRIGDQTDLGKCTYIRCIFSSTGNGGVTLKAGTSLLVRSEEAYEDMTTGIFSAENYPKALKPEHLNLLLKGPLDIEI